MHEGLGRPQVEELRQLRSRVAKLEHDGARREDIAEAYRILVDHSLQGLMLLQDERIVFANQAAADITGYKTDELLTTTLEQAMGVIHPEDRPMVWQRHEDRLKGLPVPSRYELRVTHGDGSPRWLEIHAGMVEYRGRPAVQIILTDIAERKNADEQLRESQKAFRDLVENVNDVLYGVDASGVMTYVSPAVEQVFGYLPSELTGRSFWPLVVAEDIPGVEQAFQDLLNLKTCPHEFRMLTPTGDIRWVRTSGRPITDGDQVAGIHGVLVDITEQKRAEETLRQSEQRKTILNQIANVFLTLPDEEMYAEVLAVVLKATESKFGVFGFIAENGDLVVPSMTREIWSACQVPDKSIIFPADTWGNSLRGRAIREQKAFYSDGPFHTPAGHIPIDCFLTAPIVFGNKTIGLLSVANRQQSYAKEDKDLLESITNYCVGSAAIGQLL
jgi:PAS domain S-box-containing protein